MGVYRYYASEAQVKFITAMRDQLVVDGIDIPSAAQSGAVELLSQSQASRLIEYLKEKLLNSTRAEVEL